MVGVGVQGPLGDGCLVVGGGAAVVAQGVADAGVDGLHGVGGAFQGGVEREFLDEGVRLFV